MKDQASYYSNYPESSKFKEIQSFRHEANKLSADIVMKKDMNIVFLMKKTHPEVLIDLVNTKKLMARHLKDQKWLEKFIEY